MAKTGAILAPHQKQPRVVSSKMGRHVLRRESQTGLCVRTDRGGEMVTRLAAGGITVLVRHAAADDPPHRPTQAAGARTARAF